MRNITWSTFKLKLVNSKRKMHASLSVQVSHYWVLNVCSLLLSVCYQDHTQSLLCNEWQLLAMRKQFIWSLGHYLWTFYVTFFKRKHDRFYKDILGLDEWVIEIWDHKMYCDIEWYVFYLFSLHFPLTIGGLLKKKNGDRPCFLW